MKELKKKFSLIMALVILSVSYVFADKTPISNLYEYHLDNGLTLFVAENHSVPLAYVEIAVKAGATTQTPETAGLFHLYEHMMFKGNALYKDAASVQKALSDMGVADWNGTTGVDHVNYYFTIPSDQSENGLAFWNAAIRSPSMNEIEFEGEKDVVLAEIEGDVADPDSILVNYMNGELFPDAPYRNDPAGSYPVVKNATVEQLRYIQNHYYIPANACLFVGGDVKSSDVYAMVKKIYGSWSNNGNSAPLPAPQQKTEPFSDVDYVVMPYDRLGSDYAITYVSWRGPDTDYDLEDTYAADYLCQLMADPSGILKQSIVNNEELGVPATDYVSGGYGTSRAAGQIDFTAYMLDPSSSLASRAKLFMEQIQNEIVPSIAEDESLYSKAMVKQIASNLENDDIFNAQTAKGLLSNLRFWWCCSSPDYYYSYNKKLLNIKQSDMQKFIAKYFEGKKPLVTVLVNPSVYNVTKNEYKALGYKVVDAGSSQWWNKEQFAVNEEIKASQKGFSPKEDIYVPSKKDGKTYEVKEPVITSLKLSNGINVYVKNDKGTKVDSLAIALKGGSVQHLTFETAGLEKALFNLMSMSSVNYDYDERNSFEYTTGSSIGSSSYLAGSYLSLTSLDKNFYDTLSVLADGIVNPDFNEELYGYIMNDFRQSLESTFNDPSSYLSYEMQQTIYKDHPYRVRTAANPSSIDNITLDAIKKLYSRIVTPEDIYVVAVGNIDAKKLVKELNKSLGLLKSTGYAIDKDFTVEDVKVKGDPVILTHPSAAGAGFAARVVSTPDYTDPDYMAAVLAKNMLSSVMFNVVREHYQACYTPYAALASSKANYGYEYLYKVTKYQDFAKYMKEARSYVADDKLIESLDDEGKYVTSSIESRLDSYKNSYINSTYEENATSAGVCSTLTYNLMMYGDITFDTKQTNQMLSCSAEDVLRAFNRYFMGEDYRWFVITGPDEAKKVKLD